jgi:hypothetical protein
VGSQDFDPLNVFLWLFIGIMFKLPALDRSTDKPPRSTRVPPDSLDGELVAEPSDGRVEGVPGRAREPAYAAD